MLLREWFTRNKEKPLSSGVGLQNCGGFSSVYNILKGAIHNLIKSGRNRCNGVEMYEEPTKRRAFFTHIRDEIIKIVNSRNRHVNCTVHISMKFAEFRFNFFTFGTLFSVCCTISFLRFMPFSKRPLPYN
jgi:hypothetical protein